MGLTEVPSELFRMEHLKRLYLTTNNLCSLPSEIAHLATLEELGVRFSKRSRRDLTTGTLFSGQRQPARVSSPRARSADQSQDALRASLEAQVDLDLTAVSRFQVGENQLTSLPAQIGQLRELEWLRVRNSN
jgi:leucine-rich repeat protein SHOC2